jgi:hypothetical protein
MIDRLIRENAERLALDALLRRRASMRIETPKERVRGR